MLEVQYQVRDLQGVMCRQKVIARVVVLLHRRPAFRGQRFTLHAQRGQMCSFPYTLSVVRGAKKNRMQVLILRGLGEIAAVLQVLIEVALLREYDRVR